MILLLLIQRVTSKDLVAIDLLDNDDSQVSQFEEIKLHLSDILHHNFEMIRHSLIIEAITTIQSYILCIEWHFIEQRYEESWSMMFHTCSISYSIGLHVMGKFGMMGKRDLKEKDEEIRRCRVWYALKNISGQISSILGRPSPISLHVDSPMLTASTPNYFWLEIEKDKMLVSLKVGLSEYLKLSNTMLIENLMKDISIDELLRLDSKFKKDIHLVKVLLNDKLYDSEGLFDDLETDLMDEDSNDDRTENQWFLVNKGTLLVDLITFYINRAKLFQPFILKFQDSNNSTTVIELLQESINQFLDYLIYFVNSFLNKFNLKYEEANFRYLKIKAFRKVLKSHYPFLHSFIYQGMLVIFTVLHYKNKDFIECEDDGKNTNYSEFLNKVGQDLNTLLKLEYNFAGIKCNHNKLWSSNITDLIHLDIAHIENIRKKQITKIQIDREKFQNEVNELQNQINLGCIPESELHSFNIHYPFWLTCPDNLPYHLASPSDEDKPSSRLRNLMPEMVALSSYPDYPRQPQPFRLSQVSSNILVDDFDTQGGAPFGDSWSNSSYPSKSTSCMSQLPQESLSSAQGGQQQQSTMPDSYDLDISQQ
jgi:hypothetical protein